MSESQITKRQRDIIDILRKESSLSANSMSEGLSVTQRTIERDITALQKAGLIYREGSRQLGHWVVVKQGY